MATNCETQILQYSSYFQAILSNLFNKLILTSLQVSPWGRLWIRGGGGSEITSPCLMDNLARHTSFVSALKGECGKSYEEAAPHMSWARIYRARQLSDETRTDGTHWLSDIKVVFLTVLWTHASFTWKVKCTGTHALILCHNRVENICQLE